MKNTAAEFIYRTVFVDARHSGIDGMKKED